MADDDAPVHSGSPPWVITFADLMSLLMCFFVLLLSFSETELQKFKQVAGSMGKAFGTQGQIKFIEMPRGTSTIIQEFSPGKPDPISLNVVKQHAIPDIGSLLKIETEKKNPNKNNAIVEGIKKEIQSGNIEVETQNNKIVIRILEKGSFASGSASLRPSFLPVIAKISDILQNIPGQITVAGYTDNVPIQTDIFRSNWELSSTRAVSVIQELLKNKNLDSRRFLVAGFGENKPLVANNTPENRSKNRRVELIIFQGSEYEFNENEVINIEDESDVLKMDIGSEYVDPTFSSHSEMTSNEKDDTDAASGLGIFEEEKLYNYDLNDVILDEKIIEKEFNFEKSLPKEQGVTKIPPKDLEEVLREGLQEIDDTLHENDLSEEFRKSDDVIPTDNIQKEIPDKTSEKTLEKLPKKPSEQVLEKAPAEELEDAKDSSEILENSVEEDELLSPSSSPVENQGSSERIVEVEKNLKNNSLEDSIHKNSQDNSKDNVSE